ncbi:hypothetical protein OAF98_01940 [Planctomicrobium sp.]|jgi:hypothetical protein|nr:hypothetical protein [Planctomicrobium sp.]MDB4743222.1 hypothetical protein [Planctomicrobium sp.]MDB4793385.1 hypothetical protein [bacterium]
MRNRTIPLVWMLLVAGSVHSTFAQEPNGDSEDSPTSPPSVGAAPASDLHNVQKQIFRDYERFEKSLFDVAEQMRRKDPEQADILYRARSKSQEENLLADMELIAELLRSSEEDGEKKSAQYGPAVDRQSEVLARMESILKLLDSLDARQRNAELIKKIEEIRKAAIRTIAGQKDTRAETLRGRDSKQLQDAQKKVQDQADDLAKKIDDLNKQQSEEKESNDSEASEQKEGEQTEKGSEKMDENETSEKSGETKKPEESEQQSTEDGSEQKPGEGQPKESKQGEQQPSDSQQQSQQQSQESQESPEGQQQQSQQQQQKKDEQTPGREQLDEARKQMEKAIEDLLKDQKDDAVEHQDDSIAHLEKLKAELEEILRQLREEEKETYLTLLEARFQNMLRRQLQINSETKRLDEIPKESRPQQSYASKTNEARKEQEDNAIDAEKALNLLREEGSSVAFPEAVEQMNKNMQVVVSRLANEDTGKTTQLVEVLIVETLEEMIDAFQKEMKKQEEQQQNGQPQQQGQPQDPALVDQIAELKMIRSLQLQVNRITQQLGTEVVDPSAVDVDQQTLIDDIAQRQKRIQEATYDLSVGRNK